MRNAHPVNSIYKQIGQYLEHISRNIRSPLDGHIPRSGTRSSFEFYLSSNVHNVHQLRQAS